MRRTWRIRRDLVGVLDGQARWDHAYQLVLAGEKSSLVGPRSQEGEQDASSVLCARFNGSAAAGPETIEQQVTRLWAYVGNHPDWVLREEHIFRDDGYRGARLQRPGLDALRDHVARAEFDVVVIT